MLVDRNDYVGEAPGFARRRSLTLHTLAKVAKDTAVRTGRTVREVTTAAFGEHLVAVNVTRATVDPAVAGDLPIDLIDRKNSWRACNEQPYHHDRQEANEVLHR